MATLDCDGHESTSGPMGVSVYCDGSCKGKRPVRRTVTSKTISVGGEVGSNGLRFSVSVQWNKIGFMQSRRFLCVKVGAHEVYHEEFNEPNRRHACSILTAMLATAEPDLCKYLTRALMEVEL